MPLTALREVSAPAPQASLLDPVDRIAARDLSPLVQRIDREGHYPEAVLRQLGQAGAFAAHLTSSGGERGRLFDAVAAMARVGQDCLSTSFCMWCQDTFAWYLENTENQQLKRATLPGAASGKILGGTGLSNPMKALARIEPLRLGAVETCDGFVLNGTLPWVSNLGPGHLFGTAFPVQGDGRLVMALVDCSQEGVRLGDGARFLALDGTRTCSVTFRDALVPRSMVLADDALPFIARIKPGFILLQCGMALGLIRGCVELMRRCDESGSDTNRFLQDRPETFDEALVRLTRDVAALSETPLETSREYMRRVLETRLEASEWSLRAAQAAMLHAGARGYVAGAPAQRRLRESYFIAIVTPATKHLRRELACLQARGQERPE